MNAQTKIHAIDELTDELVQLRVDECHTDNRYEREVRKASIKAIIADAEAKQSRLDQAIDDEDALIADLSSQLANAQERRNNYATAYADCRVAIVKGHIELADLSEQEKR